MTTSINGGAVYLEVEVQGIDHICFWWKTLVKWNMIIMTMQLKFAGIERFRSSKPDDFTTTKSRISQSNSLSVRSLKRGQFSWESLQRSTVTQQRGSQGQKVMHNPSNMIIWECTEVCGRCMERPQRLLIMAKTDGWDDFLKYWIVFCG